MGALGLCTPRGTEGKRLGMEAPGWHPSIPVICRLSLQDYYNFKVILGVIISPRQDSATQKDPDFQNESQ